MPHPHPPVSGLEVYITKIKMKGRPTPILVPLEVSIGVTAYVFNL